MVANNHPIFGEVISIYTRAQAIEDGVLYDLTPASQEMGFVIPVACTVEVQAVLNQRFLTGQSYAGRVHDLLFLLLCRIRSSDIQVKATSVVEFTGIFGNKVERFQAECHPGDGGLADPVITIKLQ